MTTQHFDGLIAALFTPLHPDGSVHYELIPDLVQHLIDSGVKGIFVCGSNGEGPNLTLEERMQILEVVIQSAKGQLYIISHVGHASIAEAQKLARHAAQAGAHAISSVAAFYFKPTSVQNLADCMTAIASAAPTLPFYYYHIPMLTGISIDTVAFMELAEQQIPNFVGIKYTAFTIWEYQSCLNYKQKKYDVLYGFDENYLSALAVGAKGAIGSTFNFAAPLYLKVRQYFENGQLDKAQELMLLLVEMVRIFIKYPPIPAQKAIMKMIGFDLGPCRLPLQALSDEDSHQLFEQLSSIQFFDHLNLSLAPQK